MRSLTFIILSCTFIFSVSFAEVTVGMSEADLVEAQPVATGVIEAGNRKFYQWPELEAVVVSGVVQSFKKRTRAEEASVQVSERDDPVNEQIQAVREKQSEKARLLREKQAIENQAYAERQSQLLATERSIQSEVQRWNEKEKEVRRKTTMSELRKWSALRDDYLTVLREELLATYAGDRNTASVKGKIRSRLELDLNRRTDRYLDYTDKVYDVRTERYSY